MLKRPLISEKSMKLAQDSQYTFEVAKELNKIQIAHLVETRFKVDVVMVRTINVKGKTKNQRSRRKQYKTADLKKAIVFLKGGQKIPLFESVQPEESSSANASADREVQVTTAEGEPVTVLKEKKSLLRGTKVKVEKDSSRGQEDLKTSHKEKKKGGSK